MGISLGGRDFVERLPDEMAGQRMLMSGLLDFCEDEESVRWLVIGCSVARGAADELSDLDMAIGVRDNEFDGAISKIRTAVDALGDLVESYQHKLPSVTSAHMRIFAQYADRCQVDLVVFPASVSAEPFTRVVALYDPDAMIRSSAGQRSPSPDQVREWAFQGWCALADAGKYLRRRSMWEALGRLNEARDQLWRLHAVAARVPDPQFGLTSILDFAPESVGPDIGATVADLDYARLVSAVQHAARLLDHVGQQLPGQHCPALPGAMARFVISDLRRLTAVRGDGSEQEAGDGQQRALG